MTVISTKDRLLTRKPGEDSQLRPVRSSPRHLEIIGLRCGIQKSWEKSPCGGRLRVEDFHPKNWHKQDRNEIYCEKCNTCDPNGWARQDEILPAARDYFHALPELIDVLKGWGDAIPTTRVVRCLWGASILAIDKRINERDKP